MFAGRDVVDINAVGTTGGGELSVGTDCDCIDRVLGSSVNGMPVYWNDIVDLTLGTLFDP